MNHKLFSVRNTVFLTLLLLVSLLLTMATALPKAGAATNKQIIAYFAQWGIYGRKYYIKDVHTSGSAAKMTILNYAFANIKNGECIMVTQTGVMDAYADYQKSFAASESVDGVADNWSQTLRGNFNQIKKLKALHPQLKAVISLGGWTWSDEFSDVASTAAGRQRVAASCIDIYVKGNLPVGDGAGGPGVAAGIFDGIDIDWEFPGDPGEGNTFRAEDKENFTLLLQEFRKQLDAINPNLLLTVAISAGSDKIDNLELDKFSQYLNYVNVMTYDMHGAWENRTNFQAALYGSPNDPSSAPANTYNIDYAVNMLLQGGVPASKLVIGVPFYGRGWTGVPNINNGLYQTATGGATGTYESGIEDYKVLKNFAGTTYRDPITKQMWKYDGTTFWTYDDEQVIAEKMAYINAKGLAGAMAWELDGDDGTLMNAVYAGLNGSSPVTPVATNTPVVGATSTPVVVPTSTPVVVPTATPLPGSCVATAWSSSTTYTAGQTASYNNRQWRAKWWVQGEVPGSTQWGAWEDLGACGGTTNPTATPIAPTATAVAPTATATKVATATPIAPTATAVAPTATATPIAPTATPSGSCSVAAWAATSTYVGGNIVSHKGRQWKAQWWTTGEEPGTTGQWGVWLDLGGC